MRNTPFGYRIEGGVAVIDEISAAKVRRLYKNYLSGMGLTVAAKEAGINCFHAGAKRILQNRRYLGDDYYPTIIDEETYYKVLAEITNQADKLRRLDKKPTTEALQAPTRFSIQPIKENFADPFEQAQYIYSLIESEVHR